MNREGDNKSGWFQSYNNFYHLFFCKFNRCESVTL
jgi:hypothetical protein